MAGNKLSAVSDATDVDSDAGSFTSLKSGAREARARQTSTQELHIRAPADTCGAAAEAREVTCITTS